ncbi:MAG TPA: hypothetical protein VM450_10020 [Thermomicrobiales bacterium]|nr:hypothetical protein [Thermomicrobiales bacterium]
MSSTTYLQPIASHEDYPERLLLRDGEDQWYLWTGDGQEIEAIPARLAAWIADRPEMRLLQRPHMWFELSCLPLNPAAMLTDR